VPAAWRIAQIWQPAPLWRALRDRAGGSTTPFLDAVPDALETESLMPTVTQSQSSPSRAAARRARDRELDASLKMAVKKLVRETNSQHVSVYELRLAIRRVTEYARVLASQLRKCPTDPQLPAKVKCAAVELSVLHQTLETAERAAGRRARKLAANRTTSGK
jgi:hypothetical protein